MYQCLGQSCTRFSIRNVADRTLKISSGSLLSAAVRLAEAGRDTEAMLPIDSMGKIHEAEDEMRQHAKAAGTGMIVKMSTR